MLASMVTACSGWMRAGLPLRVLKLVIYSKTNDIKALSSDDRTAITTFQQLKKRIGDLKVVRVIYFVLQSPCCCHV